MKTGYELKFKRRREGKTNYRKRLKLLLSKKPRLIVRRSLSNIRAQFAEYSPKGDKIKITAFSKELAKGGWQYSTDSLPAAYLTGLLCGVRAKEAGIKEAVFDMGLNQPIKGARIYAALKGTIDAGIKIPADAGSFPKEERIKGAHIANYAEKLKKEKPEEYSKRFSSYLAKKADPIKMAAAVEELKKKITSGQIKGSEKKK